MELKVFLGISLTLLGIHFQCLIVCLLIVQLVAGIPWQWGNGQNGHNGVGGGGGGAGGAGAAGRGCVPWNSPGAGKYHQGGWGGWGGWGNQNIPGGVGGPGGQRGPDAPCPPGMVNGI